MRLVLSRLSAGHEIPTLKIITVLRLETPTFCNNEKSLLQKSGKSLTLTGTAVAQLRSGKKDSFARINYVDRLFISAATSNADASFKTLRTQFATCPLTGFPSLILPLDFPY
jgi:hypothetical protein